MAVAELMRILLDGENLDWDKAWDPDAANAGVHEPYAAAGSGRWPVAWFELLLPQQLEIIYEINRRQPFCSSPVPRR